MNKILIKNVTIVTMNKNRDIIENGILVIKDDKIVNIYGDSSFESFVEEKYRDYYIIDGEGGILGETVLNFPSPDSSNPYGGIEYSKKFIEKWKKDELIIPAIAPHAPYTNDDRHLIEAYNVSKKYDVPFIMHVA